MVQYLRSRAQASPQEPLFITEGGEPLSRAWFSSRLRLLCQLCGLPPERYTPHSFRIGAATTAAMVAPVSTLKAMGRWSSSAFERYLRPGNRAILDARKAMSLALWLPGISCSRGSKHCRRGCFGGFICCCAPCLCRS